MAKVKKSRNWRAVRLTYREGEDGWSECDQWKLAHIDNPDVVITGDGMERLVGKIVGEVPGHWVFVNLNTDGRLVMAWLLHHGWRSVDDESPHEKEFRPLIAEDGSIIRIRIRGDKGLQDFEDLQRLVPMSIKSLREIVTDGTTDWRISDDVNVAARMVSKLNTEDLTRITLSSNAYNDWLDTFGRDNARRKFPKMNADVNEASAKAFTGGFTWLSPQWCGKMTPEGISVDANSLYPSVALAEPLPVGKPKRFEGKAEDNGLLTLQTAVVDWSLLEDGFPCLARRWRKWEIDPGESPEPVELTLTDIDWEIFVENYDLTVVEWCGGWQFYPMTGMFDEYFGKWGGKKQHSEGANRLLAKLMCNSLLGKFGTHTKRASRVPVLHDDGTVTYDLQPVKTNHGIYTPLAAWVNAYARRELVHAMHANRDRVIYADTDSMHLIGTEEPKGIKIDPSAFGAWKVEKHFSESKHLREKSYMWTDAETGEVTCKVSGMPDNITRIMDYGKFNPGWKNWDENGVKKGLERWMPLIEGEHVRMIPGKYKIGSAII